LPDLVPTPTHVDVIVPVFDEEQAVLAFHDQLCQVLDQLAFTFTIYYIDDGSTDQTAQHLHNLARQDRRVQVVELSRNFGHQAALTAGLDLAQGDLVITMDGDGQHPPALIPQMLALAQAGYEVVLTQRVDEIGVSGFKRWTSDQFYHLINRIGDTHILPGSADFRLMSRPVVDALRNMREYHRFLRGMVAWSGYRSVILPFTPPARLGGKSKYSLRKMLVLGMDAVFSFSLVPLYIALSVGVLFLCMALAEVAYVLSFWVSGHTERLAPGWSSLMFMLLLVGGALMVFLGFLGIYIGYIFQEVKRRPIYLVRRGPSPQDEPQPIPPVEEAHE
jgi:glycosyltransferase involved in cell wall biosynthesis